MNVKEDNIMENYKQTKDQETISVLVATDNNGCPWLATLIVSLGLSTNSNISLYVFQSKLKKDHKEKLNITAQKVGVKIQFVEMNGDFDWYVPDQWPLPALYRLMADNILSTLDKIIYLDIDTLVYKDISLLWMTDLEDNYLGACWGLDIHRDLGLLDPEKKVKEYFNSGVLLMNLKKMREDHIGEKCIQFMCQFKDSLHAPDQDALNVVCAGKIKPLPICWNWYISLDRRSKRVLRKIYKNYLSKEPAIIHFYSKFKPNRIFIYLKHPIATYRIWKKGRFFWRCLKETPYEMKKKIEFTI